MKSTQGVRFKVNGCRGKTFLGILLSIVMIGVSIGPWGSALAQDKPPFAGREIVIGIPSGGPSGNVSGPWYYWRDEWERLSGAKLHMGEIPFTELFQKYMMDFITGAGEYDGIEPTFEWYGSFLARDYITPIDAYFGDPRFPEWPRDQVTPAMKDLITWKGKWYGHPNDADAHVLYYRKDILARPDYAAEFEGKYGYDLPVPPVTFEQLSDVAEFFNGWDWSGDGKPDVGISMSGKIGRLYYYFSSLAGVYNVTTGPVTDKYHNVLWFDPETMEPLIAQPGFVKAAEMFFKLFSAGPEAMKTWGLGEQWDTFLKGSAVFTYSWGDVGPLAQDPERSNIQGKLGVAVMPGSEVVWDRRSGAFKSLDEPNILGNSLGASWHLVTSAYSDNPEVVYHLMAFHSTAEVSNWNASLGWTGIDMGGYEFHFLPPAGTASLDLFLEAGWDKSDIIEYSKGQSENWAREGQIPNLRIPGTAEYMRILDIELSSALVGQKSIQEALDSVYEEWQTITGRLGKEQQLQLYQDSVGYVK